MRAEETIEIYNKTLLMVLQKSNLNIVTSISNSSISAPMLQTDQVTSLDQETLFSIH